MFLKKLAIHNYKSLRNVCFTPEPFTALIGPNASGKSNFADAVHFLSEVYKHGLEAAIARKGGYENIAFRKKRRTTAAIDFEVTIHVTESTDSIFSQILESYDINKNDLVELTHVFSIQAERTGIRANFKVTQENFTISWFPSDMHTNGQPEDGIRIFRTSNGTLDTLPLMPWGIGDPGGISAGVQESVSRYNMIEEERIGEQSLFLKGFRVLESPYFFFREFSSTISRFRIHQFSPQSCREPSAPTPNPELSRWGKNLPALIEWLQKNHSKAWKQVVADMQDILQGLNQISLQYLHTKTLGLFFEEEGFGRAWNVDEISDGTIQALAILVAAADPRTSLLLIEEPENSVHPWIVRKLVERLKAVSKDKNVVVTSQSPVLIDLLRPKEVWIAARQDGETQIRQLTDLDPSIEENWKAGQYRLSEFLDSGLVPQVVPGGVF